MNNTNQSYTIWSPHDTVKDVAESLGIDNIPDDVLKALAMDVEYRILEIIEQAVKFKRHSKRDVLTTSDVAKALSVLNVEPLYGYHDGSAHNRDVSFTKVNIGNTDQSIYFMNDEEVDFEKLINEPLPQVPRLPTFSAHWLAIEGVQPAIPQNPNLNEIKISQPPIIRGAIVTALNDNSFQNTSATSSSSMVLANEEKETERLSTVKPGQNTEVKPLVKHVLSKELQIYFDKVITALTSKNSSSHLKNAALTSLKTDSGLHQLVPYFIQFIAEQITHHLSDLELLTSILEMIYSLLSNESIFLDPYIHSLMPSILTLLLAKQLGTVPNSEDETERLSFLEKTNALRNFAASMLDYVLKKFPQIYKSLKPRVIRTLLKTFLDTNRVYGTYYGCLRGVSVLGTETIRFFLGNLNNWAHLVFNEQNLTLDTIDDNDSNTTSFSDAEKKFLVETAINTLVQLKADLPEIYDGKDGDITEQDKEKLVERCGVTIASAILKRDDANELICAVFFGE